MKECFIKVDVTNDYENYTTVFSVKPKRNCSQAYHNFVGLLDKYKNDYTFTMLYCECGQIACGEFQRAPSSNDWNEMLKCFETSFGEKVSNK